MWMAHPQPQWNSLQAQLVVLLLQLILKIPRTDQNHSLENARKSLRRDLTDFQTVATSRPQPSQSPPQCLTDRLLLAEAASQPLGLFGYTGQVPSDFRYLPIQSVAVEIPDQAP